MNDGGPAFPVITEHNSLNSSGMSLRDYFAAAALQGRGQEWGEDGFGFEKIAVLAYAQADAMIAERSKQK